MNPNLNLYPSNIQAQCACATTQLQEQSEALSELKMSITEFVNDSSIHSVSFDQLKSQCRNYLDVIDAMIYCNEQDKTDFVTLQGSVGNEDLVGAIIDKWERYYKQKLDETRRNYENVKGMVSGYAALQMQAYYANLIQMYQQLYNYWYAKELAYYEIDGKTSTLFAKSYGRHAISNLLSALKDSFKLEEGYNSNMVAAQAIKVKNAVVGSVQMDPSIKAVYDAMIKSGMDVDEVAFIISKIRINCPNELENLNRIISSAGYNTGLEAVNSFPNIRYEIAYQNWLYKSNELAQYYVKNVNTYCTKIPGEKGYGSTSYGRKSYKVKEGSLGVVFDREEVRDDCSSYVYYSLVSSGFAEYTDCPPNSALYLPSSGNEIVKNLKAQGFVWYSNEDLKPEDVQKGDILVKSGHVEIFDHFDEKGKEWAYSWGEVAPYEPYEKKCSKNNLFNVYRGVWRYEGK